MDQPCVSIIIPIYNGEKTINESLDSLLKQDYINKNLKSVEIIVINDNSTDNSLEFAKNFFEKHKFKKSKIIINKKKNKIRKL